MTSSRSLSLTFLAFMLVCAEIFQPFVISQRSYEEDCNKHRDCATIFCNPSKNKCDCPSLPTDRRTSEKQFYDGDLMLCLSRVGQRCTRADDGLTKFECAPNAVCEPERGQHQSNAVFGTCKCQKGSQPNEDRSRCISEAELRTEKGPTSMDQVNLERLKGKSGSNSLTRSSAFESGAVIIVSFFSTVFCLFPYR